MWTKLQTKFDNEINIPTLVLENEWSDVFSVYLRTAREDSDKLSTFEALQVEDFTLDLGGMYYALRKEFSIQLNGLRVEVPATQVEDYIDIIQNKSPESIPGIPEFFGIARMYGYLILSNENRKKLLWELTKLVPEALVYTSQENDHINKVLSSSKHVTGPLRKVPIPPVES